MTGPLPRRYYAWLGAASVSALGDAVLYFGLGWAAAGLGAGWAGLVLTMITLPRAVLLLIGGAAGDRWGPRRVMIIGDAIMCVLTAVLAIGAGIAGATPLLLMAAGLCMGIVDAFYLPATGSFPRLFVTDAQLPRALALRQSTGQVIGLVGAPVGGALVAAGGLVTAALVDAASFAVVFAVLLAVRPAESPAPRIPRTSVLSDAVGGVRLVLSDPLLRKLIAATGLVAAFYLPMTVLCLPLLVRAHGWSPTWAGLIAGASVCGTLAVSLVVAKRGTASARTDGATPVRLGPVVGTGAIVAGVAIAGLAVSPSPVLACLSALVQGLGIGLFVSHIAPLVMTRAPRTHLTRVQSVLALVQTVPLLASNNLIAALVSHAGTVPASLTCAAGTGGAGLLLLVTRRPRRRTSPPSRRSRAEAHDWRSSSVPQP